MMFKWLLEFNPIEKDNGSIKTNITSTVAQDMLKHLTIAVAIMKKKLPFCTDMKINNFIFP